jgi:hypothetical protein
MFSFFLYKFFFLLETCRNRRWKRSGGNMFHAIVSVMAVKIQLSSPMIVLRLLSCPGIWSSRCGSMFTSGEGRVENLCICVSV